MNGYDKAQLAATEILDNDGGWTVAEAAGEALSGLTAEEHVEVARAFLTGDHTPEGAVLADALAEALATRMARDLHRTAAEGTPTWEAMVRRVANGERTPRGGFVGWGNSPEPDERGQMLYRQDARP